MFYSQKPPSAVPFVKGSSKPPFSLCQPCSWVTFEGTGHLPPQHFALSTSSRHLVAKDCIYQLPRWKANKSFWLPCCPTPTLGMKCKVMSKLSVCFRAQCNTSQKPQKQPRRLRSNTLAILLAAETGVDPVPRCPGGVYCNCNTGSAAADLVK